MRVLLGPSMNRTSLIEAGMILDSQLEKELASMGLLSSSEDVPLLECTIVSTSRERITSSSLQQTDRYRLIISVLAELRDRSGTVLWRSRFTDEGVYLEGGQDEDALEEACRAVAQQIARTLAAVSL
ncbi:MAG: LPS assembly lipoprotein LptE [Desulfomonilia bacterium]